MSVADAHDVEPAPPRERQRKPRRNLLRQAAAWVQRDHLRRGPVPVIGAVAAVAATAHWADVPAWPGIPLTLVAAIGMTAREMNLPGPAGLRKPHRAGIASLATGSWLTAATEWGVTAGPEGFPGMMAVLGAATAGLAYWAYRRDPAITSALAQQKARDDWHMRAPSYGLSGSHLLDWRETRLGEQFELDTRGTGRRVSQLVNSDIGEIIAEQEMLPTSRVKVRAGRIAGRMTVSIRYKDPWAAPLPHPLLDPTPEIVLPPVADAREPRIVGMEPDSGRPLEVVVWDEEGAKRVIIVAATGSGKTVLLNNMYERETAADNSFPIGINVSKAKELRRWRNALGASACGPHERQKAFYLLRMCRHIIDYRGSMEDTDTATVEPSADMPLVPVFVDEMDELLKYTDTLGQATREELEYLSTKGRSEAVTWVLAGPRGTANFTGGGTTRNMADTVILGRVARRSEMQHAAGDVGAVLPDLTSYGEGKAGVQLLLDVRSGHWQTGRTHFLEKLTDIDRLAAGRLPCPLEPAVMAYVREQMGSELVDALLSTEPFVPPGKKARPAPARQAAAPIPAVGGEPEEEQGRAAASRARAVQSLAEAPALDMSLTSGQRRQIATERRRQAASETRLDPEVRALILKMAAEPDGTSTRLIEAALEREIGHERGLSRNGAWRYLDVLRFEGVVELHGQGRGQRWHLSTPTPDVPPMADVDEKAVEDLAEDAADEATDNAEDYEE